MSGAADRLTFSRDELLESGAYAEPLVAGGVRCHGGFEPGGALPLAAHGAPRRPRSPPGRRGSRAKAPRSSRSPRALMPPQYPNVAQAKLLLQHGVRDPIVRTLTIVSIVEGFGAIIRDVAVPDLGALVGRADRRHRARASRRRARSKRTRATRRATATRAATSRCGRPRATSRSRSRRSPATC